jgi:hypothetical protein
VSGLWTALAVAAAALGVGLLRLAWSRRSGARLGAAGWLALAAGAPAWRASGADWDKAVAFAALAPSLVALAVVALGAELKRPHRRKPPRTVQRAAPPPAPGSRRIALARLALAGPAAGAAALAAAALVALRAPWSEADRLVAAGFLLPIGWAAGCVWATTDARLARVAAGLAAVAAGGLAGAWL